MTTSPEEPSGSGTAAHVSADGLLALRYLAGDEDGFTELFRRYHPDVVRLVRATVRDRELAEDVAQEAMARALRYLHTYDPTRPFWPWLRRITASALAAEVTGRSAETPVAQVEGSALTGPDAAERLVTYDAVRRALEALPPRQRRALVMRYVEDRDANDLAALFGLSRNAFEQLLLRARTKFRDGYRDGVLVPLGGFGARLRRLVAAIEARMQVATGATWSVAGDVAFGAVLAFGGIGLATLGRDEPAPHAAAALPWAAAAPGGGGHAAHPLRALGALAAPAGLVPAPVPAAPQPRWAAGAATGGYRADPVGPPARPPAGAPRLAAPRPTAPPAATPAPATAPDAADPAPAGPGAGASPTPAAPAPGPAAERAAEPGPAPEPAPAPTAVVGGDGAAVVVADEQVPETSAQVSVKSDPTQEGEVAKSETKTTAGGKALAPGVSVSNSEGDGFLCKRTGVCVT